MTAAAAIQDALVDTIVVFYKIVDNLISIVGQGHNVLADHEGKKSTDYIVAVSSRRECSF